MLKYLNEIGPERNVTLQMENAHGLAPIMYTMLNQKVYSFIYLYFKQNCELSKDSVTWATTHMVRQSTETQIIQLLLHDVKLGHIVARVALDTSVETGNVQVLKAVLKRHSAVDPQCLINIFTIEKLKELAQSTDELEVKNILHTHLAKIEVARKGVCSLLCSSKMFNKSVFKTVTKKIAPYTGFMLVSTLLLFFLSQAIRLQESYVNYEGSIGEYFDGIMACFSTNILLLVALVLMFNSVSCLLWSLIFSPGVQPILRLDQEENVVNKIC